MMIRLAPINTHKLRTLIEDIEKCRRELTQLTKCSKDEFVINRHLYAETEHYFRRALEGILTAGTHILSRLPSETKDYTAIILALGDAEIIPPDFAQRNLGLAGYRNRLVHLYWQVEPPELYDTIREHLEDIGKFAEFFQLVLQDPKKFGLQIE